MGGRPGCCERVKSLVELKPAGSGMEITTANHDSELPLTVHWEEGIVESLERIV
jgi:hypothetical protein